ncbi:MAG: hemerythrin domain-containing protein [Hyphomicrobiales bacterium]|nr:hemerythrin domain-containing protein [Hyphomicrobiales bacterium]
MDFERHITRMLHEEHRVTLAAMENLDALLQKSRRGDVIDSNDPEIRRLLTSVDENIGSSISTHFSFEESELFTRLAEYGDEAIAMHLTAEHRLILPLSEKLGQMIAEALAGGFTPETTNAFRDAAADLIEHMMVHIQKEEMGLLPLLDDILDPETDFELSEQYG